MEHNNKLLCTGDPILDIYIGKDGSMRHFNGGALNIYQNALALLEHYCLDLRMFPNNLQYAYPSDGDFIKGDIFNCYTICRTPLHPDGVPLATEETKDVFYSPCGVAETIQEFKPDILVLGDYDKGTLNTTNWLDDNDIELPDIKYGVVDSRYRSLDLRWISTCRYKFWHATGEEYNEKWAKNFDIVFWTNGPEDVRILKHGKLIATLPVPTDTEVMNTCGSGDTFTATIAACLYAYDNISANSLTEYAKYAIDVCQDIVSQPYTSTTNKRIREECLSQT